MLGAMTGGIGASHAAGIDQSTGVAEGINVTPGSAAWGSYAVAIDPLPFTVGLVTVMACQEGAYASGALLVDIAIGDASGGGNEQTLIPSLQLGSSKGQVINTTQVYYVPILAPKGAALMVRGKRATGTSDFNVVVGVESVSPYGPTPFKKCIAYGADAAATGRGTTIDPGGTADTLTSTQVTASTGEAMKAAMFSISRAHDTIHSFASFLCNMYVATGATDYRVGPIVPFTTYTTETGLWPAAFPFPASIPSGREIGIQMQSTITDANNRLVDCIIYGLS